MWTCHHSGDCCTQPARVTVTQSERRVLEAAAKRLGLASLQWRAGEAARFTNLVARPCPFYEASVGCRVYEERPYNCRRFMCGREAGDSHRFDAGASAGIPMRVLSSEALRADYAAQQASAQPWADAHGWGGA